MTEHGGLWHTATAWETSLRLFPNAAGYHRFLALSETVAHLDYAVAENRLTMAAKDGVDLYRPL